MKLNWTVIVAVVTTLKEVLSVDKGGNCSMDSDCTPTNTYCKPALSATCTKGTCECKQDYVWDSGALKCKRKRYYRDSCTASDSSCQAGTTCTDNMCTCTGSYNTELNMCLDTAKKAVDEVCTDVSECYMDAALAKSVVCMVPTGSTGTAKKCQCAAGYSREGARCIKPRHGALCLSTEGCANRFPQFIDQDASFTAETCISGRCGCPDNHSMKIARIDGYRTINCLVNYSGTKVALGGTCMNTNECSSGSCYKCPESSSKVCVGDTE